jgi:hypothetical protein
VKVKRAHRIAVALPPSPRLFLSSRSVGKGNCGCRGEEVRSGAEFDGGAREKRTSFGVEAAQSHATVLRVDVDWRKD